MTLSAAERELESNVEITDRGRRVYRYLKRHGAVLRDRVMHFCEFPSPREQPVSAYVQFANSVTRLNRTLRWHGEAIKGGVDTGEVYKLVGGQP